MSPMPPRRTSTRFQKRKREDENYQQCPIDDDDAGRPAVKLRAGTSKTCPITVKEKHEKKNPSQETKYSNLKPPAMRNMLKPFNVPGIGAMRKNELIQLCLLYDSELNAAINTPHTVVRRLRSRTSLASFHAEPRVPSGTEGLSSTSTTHNLSARDTITEDHQSDSPRFKKPQAQMLNAHKDYDNPAEDDEHCTSDEGDQHQTMTRPNREKGALLARRRQTILDSDDEDVMNGEGEHPPLTREKEVALPRPCRSVVFDLPEENDEGAQSQVAVLPSRERGTALPRPRPTVLSEVAKGKQRRVSLSSDDWVPDASEEAMNSPGSPAMEFDEGDDEVADIARMDFDSDHQEDDSMSLSGGGREEGGDSFDLDGDSDDGARAAISKMLSAQNKRLSGAPSSSNARSTINRDENLPTNDVEDLRQTVRDLTKLVMHLVSKPGSSTVPSASRSKKPQGSTFRARIRNHVWTMMGLKDDDEVPPSATPAQQTSWKIFTSRKDMLLPCRLDRETANGLTSSANDPRFPFKGGPGGENANPQVLLVMWTMMNRVGISSFRPIWEEGMGSPVNKFLWNLATATFIHLVKAGEYDDIRAEDAKFDVVLKAMREHAKSSLKRSFRQTNQWSRARIQAHKKHGVRVGRLRTLKNRRNGIAIRNKLSTMCEILDKCCSEDETDEETEGMDSTKKIYKVKKFPWRSSRLETLLLRLEAHDERQKKDSPKNTPGAKPRTRVRGSASGLVSESQPPSGLPIDCFDSRWLDDIRINHPDQYEEFQIEETPVLDSLEKKADALLKI